jgi:glucose/arabinose dehydrogenase
MLEPGFQQTEHSVQFNPTSFDWDPSGGMWIAGRDGRIYNRATGGGLAIEVGRLTNLDATGERGLLGLAVDPDFPADPYIYLYATDAGPPARNRVIRLTFNGTSLESPAVLLEGPDLGSVMHNAGDLRFGPDGYLYVSMGNNVVVGAEQDTASLLGKILRIAKDGSVPGDNPFASDPNARPEVWALGFRNPWRFSFEPGTGNLFIGDVGDSTWEELDLGIPGANYGYPQTEGPEPPGIPGVTYPIFSYNHMGTGAAIITGERMVAGNFPAEYVGDFFYADFSLRSIFRLRLDASYTPVFNEAFVTGIDPLPVHIRVGPDGAIYYAGINYDRIYRVAWVGGTNQQPAAVIAAAPTSGPAPLGVQFDGTGSSDPDGGPQPLSYAWTFGDGGTSASSAPFHTYATPGVRTATLTVGDGQATDQKSITIVAGNTAPVPVITAPVQGSFFDAGDTIVFSGEAADPEDGALGPTSLSWTVVLHHNIHIHPYLGPTAGIASGDFFAENRGETAPDVWYEIILTATDSGAPLGPPGALSASDRVEIFPNLSTLQLRTAPAGSLALTLDGKPVTAPLDVIGVVGVIRTIGAPSPQAPGDGRTYSFSGWSDAGAQSHEIVTPASAASFEAAFDCGVLAEVDDVTADAAPGGDVTLAWSAPADPCLASGSGAYRVYAASTAVPSIPPGQFPADPPFVEVGSSGATTFTFTPSPGSEFYLVVAAGTNGTEGPSGHYAP